MKFLPSPTQIRFARGDTALREEAEGAGKLKEGENFCALLDFLFVVSLELGVRASCAL